MSDGKENALAGNPLLLLRDRVGHTDRLQRLAPKSTLRIEQY